MDRRLDKDVKAGTIQPDKTSVENITVQGAQFNRRKRKYAWLEHHYPCCTVKRGNRKWEQCPGPSCDDLIGRNRPVRKPYLIHYKCVQCSLGFGTDHYFCNDFSLGDTRNCYDLYHKKYHGNGYITTTITITIARNYVIISVLYVFYCHRRCFCCCRRCDFFHFLFSCICAHIEGVRSLKIGTLWLMVPKLLTTRSGL